MKPLPENYMKKEIVKTKLNALLYNLPAYHIDTSYIKFKSIIQDEVGLDKSLQSLASHLNHPQTLSAPPP